MYVYRVGAKHVQEWLINIRENIRNNGTCRQGDMAVERGSLEICKK
jgi:hypothetical protein